MAGAVLMGLQVESLLLSHPFKLTYPSLISYVPYVSLIRTVWIQNHSQYLWNERRLQCLGRHCFNWSPSGLAFIESHFQANLTFTSSYVSYVLLIRRVWIQNQSQYLPNELMPSISIPDRLLSNVWMFYSDFSKSKS